MHIGNTSGTPVEWNENVICRKQGVL